MAFTVARRTKEMGVRMALGAKPGSVVWLVMKEVLILLAIGLAIGIPAAAALGRYVATQLYGIKASDPIIGGATVITLLIVAGAAGLIPARRASRIDPILALRYE
jgi:ABC-type antimicrobial peptide transport system permease subunit